MGANCEESAGGRENGYDWMMGEREGEREREKEREGERGRERFGFVINNSIEVCNNVRESEMNAAVRCQKGTASLYLSLSLLHS